MMLPAFVQYVSLAVSILPVFVFLGSLVVLDSYKLVRFRAIAIAIVVGCLVAAASFLLNSWILQVTGMDGSVYRRYGAPVVEELMKSFYLIYLIRKGRIGFMVDAAIFGFAIGAGFALVENAFYVELLQDPNLLIWIIRGFGPAIMHGGATAILGIIFKNVSDRSSSGKFAAFFQGFLIAVCLHSFYNHFFFGPVVSTVLIIALLPAVMIAVFQQSENSLRQWLGVGFDSDQELLEMLMSGNLMKTPVGIYLQSLETKFIPEVVVDMICYLRIHVELSIEAKGILLMRQAGFELPPDRTVEEKFEELRALAKNIGQTGKLALSPFLHTSDKELWQLHMLTE
ncbi:MAG: PrsW family glutamic-type intramembrane protease [Bacteroidota bacterium]|jgi:RsiW-degrading membrane proteinase PrsW (M82 family)